MKEVNLDGEELVKIGKLNLVNTWASFINHTYTHVQRYSLSVPPPEDSLTVPPPEDSLTTST